MGTAPDNSYSETNWAATINYIFLRAITETNAGPILPGALDIQSVVHLQ
jgi:hypothetical protein